MATDTQIETLLAEAGAAGDVVQCALCRLALYPPGLYAADALRDDHRHLWEALNADKRWGYLCRTGSSGARMAARAECERVIAEGQG